LLSPTISAGGGGPNPADGRAGPKSGVATGRLANANGGWKGKPVKGPAVYSVSII
jgi:hypothetical protein